MSVQELRGVSLGVGTGRDELFDGLSLNAKAGRILAITGPSGSGKTTLAHVLAGLLPPDRGEVLLDGAPLSRAAIWLQPSLVPQDYGLVATLTAAETVALPLQARAQPRSEIRGHAARWLEAIGLEACAARPVRELSGGQRQRVAIARALALQAPVLVMDEPTSELDAANRDTVLSLLAREAERGRVLIVVSHDPDLVEQSDDVVELNR